MLSAKYDGENSLSNFNQIKAIPANNHGKVFEVNGTGVNIWEPASAYVNQFEYSVFDTV